jgi:uncharacterized protein
MLHIFIDADACPVKQEVYRVAQRYDLKVTLVAGSCMRVPDDDKIDLQIVDQNPDAADNWIVEHIETDDIVITADIPLAARCLEKGAYVIGPSGRPFNDDNIGSVLATRNLLSELRERGEVTGGPAPLNKRDRSRFLGQLDETINAIRRKQKNV